MGSKFAATPFLCYVVSRGATANVAGGSAISNVTRRGSTACTFTEYIGSIDASYKSKVINNLLGFPDIFSPLLQDVPLKIFFFLIFLIDDFNF